MTKYPFIETKWMGGAACQIARTVEWIHKNDGRLPKTIVVPVGIYRELEDDLKEHFRPLTIHGIPVMLDEAAKRICFNME